MKKTIAVFGSKKFSKSFHSFLKDELDKIEIEKIQTRNFEGVCVAAVEYAKEKKIDLEVFLTNDYLKNVDEIYVWWECKEKETKTDETKTKKFYFSTKLDYEEENEKLYVSGKLTYKLRSDFKKIGGEWDKEKKKWVFPSTSVKNQINDMAIDLEENNSLKRSLVAQDVWEKRKREKKAKDDFYDKMDYFSNTSAFHIFEFMFDDCCHVLIFGPNEKCKKYADDYLKKFDFMIFNTQLKVINPNKYYIHRRIEGRD